MTEQSAVFAGMSAQLRCVGIRTFQFRSEHSTSLAQKWLFYMVCET